MKKKRSQWPWGNDAVGVDDEAAVGDVLVRWFLRSSYHQDDFYHREGKKKQRRRNAERRR